MAARRHGAAACYPSCRREALDRVGAAMTTPKRVKHPQPVGQLVTDARAMRALAHPLRVALLELMRRDGEITATRAAELLGESPGNMSWHLQTLAKYGFVEETGEGRGRSRPWRLASEGQSFETGVADPEGVPPRRGP